MRLRPPSGRPAAGPGRGLAAGAAVRGCDATAACGCRTDPCAGALTLRPGASVLAGADVWHRARPHRGGLGVQRSPDAMPRLTRVLWCSWRGDCGSAARPVAGGTACASPSPRVLARWRLSAYAMGSLGRLALQPIQRHPWPHVRMFFQDGSESLKNSEMRAPRHQRRQQLLKAAFDAENFRLDIRRPCGFLIDQLGHSGHVLDAINVSCPVSHPCAIHCSISAACCVSVLRSGDIRVLLMVHPKGSGHMRAASHHHTRSCRCSTVRKALTKDPVGALAPPDTSWRRGRSRANADRGYDPYAEGAQVRAEGIR